MSSYQSQAGTLTSKEYIVPQSFLKSNQILFVPGDKVHQKSLFFFLQVAASSFTTSRLKGVDMMLTNKNQTFQSTVPC